MGAIFYAEAVEAKRKTSGLGLVISKEILLAHKAKFGVESIEEQGSVFWFALPRRQQSAALQTPADDRPVKR